MHVESFKFKVILVQFLVSGGYFFIYIPHTQKFPKCSLSYKSSPHPIRKFPELFSFAFDTSNDERLL